MTPDIYWNLELSEYLVMKAYLKAWKKEEKRQAQRARRRR